MAVAFFPEFQQAYNRAAQIGNAITEKPKDYFKGFKYSVMAIQLTSEAAKLDPTLRAAKHAFCLATTAFAFKSCTKELAALPLKAFNCISNFSTSNITKLAMGIGDSLTTGYDYYDWANLSDVATLVMPFALSISISAALVLTSTKRAYDDVCKLDARNPQNYRVDGVDVQETPFQHHVRDLNRKLTANEMARGEITEDTARNHLLADLAKNVSFVALGAFLLLSSFEVFALGSVGMLAIKIVSLVAAFSKTFHATDITLNADLHNGCGHNRFAPQFA